MRCDRMAMRGADWMDAWRGLRGGRVGTLALWGYTGAVLGTYAVLARRTAAHGETPCACDEPPGEGDSAGWPLISIILPARDEERNIQLCVESLLAQDYPHVEVI